MTSVKIVHRHNSPVSNAVYRLSLACFRFRHLRGGATIPPPVRTKLTQTPVGAGCNGKDCDTGCPVQYKACPSSDKADSVGLGVGGFAGGCWREGPPVSIDGRRAM